jgi:integrase/recombinase XerD
MKPKVNNSKKTTKKTRSSLTITYLFRPVKGGFSIYLSFSFGKPNKRIFTGFKCQPTDIRNGEFVGEEKVRIILETYKQNLNEAYNDLLFNGQTIDLERISQSMFGKPVIEEKKTLYISEAIDIYVQSTWLDDGVDLKDVTKLKSKRYFNHIKQWLKHYFGREEIELHELKSIHANEIVKFMKHHRKAGNDHAMRHVQRFKGFFDYAIGNDWIVKNPFMNFKAKMESKEIVSLSQMELSALEKEDFITGTTYDLVRDLFVFSCYTGLGYSDLKDVSCEHLKENQDGVKYLEIPRLKNEQLAIVPLRKKPLELIEKYRFEDKQLNFFRVPTNQCMNDTIKQIAQIVGIKKVLTTHIARKTFASLLKQDGIDIAIISKAMAHKHLQTTMRHYANIQAPTIINAFSQILKNK